MKITIRDVAKECRVSPFTVSSVINNKRAVKPETRQRVLDAIERLGYDPSVNVPHSRKVKTETLGLIIPRQETSSLPFYNRAVVAFANECSIAGYESTLGYMEDINDNTIKVDGSGELPDCAGLVVYCPYRDRWQHWVEKMSIRGIPQVLIRRPFSCNGIINIINDDEAGVREALNYLYASGHTRIALAAQHAEHPYLKQHVSTLQAFCREKGIAFDPDLVTGLNKDGSGAVAGWWKNLPAEKRPSAIICHDDLVAYKMIYRLQRLGVRCPEDVSIIGFDDDYGDDGVAMPLTTIRVPVEEMIRVGIRMLADRLQGIKTINARIEMPVELKIRESTRAINNDR